MRSIKLRTKKLRSTSCRGLDAVIAVLCVLIFSCGSPSSEESNCELSSAYFEHYAQRTDWDSFLERYAADVVFEDVILCKHLDGRNAFSAFYDWPDSLFLKHPDYPATLVLKQLECSDSTAVGTGYFNPFYYSGHLFSDTMHMRFTIWLEFNQSGQIVHQSDFIEYPPEILLSVAERLISETN